MLRVRPERFVAGGEALARDEDGRIVFVRGALPGEDVSVEIVEAKRDWRRGVVAEVHTASPDRVEPPCEQRRAGCGGCDWQHVTVEAQRAHKLGVVTDALIRTAKLADPAVRDGGSVPDRGYRTSIRVVGDAEQRPAFRVDRSHATVPAAGCLVAHPALAALLPDLRVAPGVEVALRVSAATGEATAHWDRRDGEVSGLPEHVAVGRKAGLHEVVAGHRLRVSAASFFQSGAAAAELLVATVLRVAPELASAQHVVDAYAGGGLFAVAAVPATCEVVAIESYRTAVADCRSNLAGRDGARIVAGDVASWRPRRHETVDVVIADPARTGLGRPGVEAVVAANAPVLILVSCDAASLARDTGLLVAAGYEHAGTDVLDVFPHTHHVEAVSRFERAR